MQGSDHSIVRAVLAGDKEAYGALVRAHSATVFRVAFRIVGNEADAEEIVQEAFLRGYQRLDSYQERSAFGTWIYRIAVNCALNRVGQPGIEAEYRHGEESDPAGEDGAGGGAGCRSGADPVEQRDQRGAEDGDATADADGKERIRAAAP